MKSTRKLDEVQVKKIYFKKSLIFKIPVLYLEMLCFDKSINEIVIIHRKMKYNEIKSLESIINLMLKNADDLTQKQNVKNNLNNYNANIQKEMYLH